MLYLRYLFWRLFKITAFFSFLLWGVALLTQSLRLVDMVIHKGMGLGFFFKMLMLLTPELWVVTMPIALFLSVVTLLVKMIQESEFKITQAMGMYPRQVMRPFIFLFSCVALFLYGCHFFLIPHAAKTFKDTEYQLKNAMTTQWFRPKTFLSRKKMTVYIQDSDADGNLYGLFLYDARGKTPQTIYAKKGWIQNQGHKIILGLQGGQRLDIREEHMRSTFVTFDTYQVHLDPGTPLKKRFEKAHEKTLTGMVETFKKDSSQRSWIFHAFLSRVISPLLPLGLIMIVFLGFYGFYQPRKNVFLPVIISTLAGGCYHMITQISLRSLKNPFMPVVSLSVLMIVTWGVTFFFKRLEE